MSGVSRWVRRLALGCAVGAVICCGLLVALLPTSTSSQIQGPGFGRLVAVTAVGALYDYDGFIPRSLVWWPHGARSHAATLVAVDDDKQQSVRSHRGRLWLFRPGRAAKALNGPGGSAPAHDQGMVIWRPGKLPLESPQNVVPVVGTYWVWERGRFVLREGWGVNRVLLNHDSLSGDGWDLTLKRDGNVIAKAPYCGVRAGPQHQALELPDRIRLVHAATSGLDWGYADYDRETLRRLDRPNHIWSILRHAAIWRVLLAALFVLVLAAVRRAPTALWVGAAIIMIHDLVLFLPDILTLITNEPYGY